MNENRVRKLNKLLAVEVAQAVKDELFFGNGTLVTVMGARVSPTLEHVTILISVIPTAKEHEVMDRLHGRIYEVQQIINRRLEMHPVPKIRFELDRTEEHAARIESILNK